MTKVKNIYSLTMLVLLAWLSVGTSAHALCGPPTDLSEVGEWTNYDPNTRSITTAVVDYYCGDVSLNGQAPLSGHYLNLFGSCHPTDCDWGSVPMSYYRDGWFRTTIFHGYATRHVWVRKYDVSHGEYLRVWIWTDFRHAGRADYASNNWFVKR